VTNNVVAIWGNRYDKYREKFMDSEGQKLENAVALLKFGNKTAARELFIELVSNNPNLDDAWVGLSLCTSRPERRKQYLTRALRVNPAHAYARSALARLEQIPAPQKAVVAPAPPPVKDPRVQRRWMEVYIGLGLAALLLFCMIAGFGFMLNQQAQAARVESLPVELTPNRYVFIDFYADW
jgi:tetratricopeptide (TPR) repeat protein